MKTKKLIAAITTMAILTSALSVPASAIYISGDYTEPMAQLLDELKADEDGYYYTDSNHPMYSFHINEKDINWYETTDIQYDIYLDKGTAFSEEEVAALSKAFRIFYSAEPITILTEEVEDVNAVTLLQNQDGSYSLSWNPDIYQFSEETLIDTLNQMPSLRAVKKNVIGFNKTEIYSNYITMNNTVLFAVTTNDTELTEADLPEDISITDFTLAENVWDNAWEKFYRIELDTEKYGNKIEPAVIYPIIKELAALEKVEKVEIGDWLIQEIAITPTDDAIIDNGAITLATRGDTDRDEKITIDDAYDALISSSKEALGEASDLSGREYTAADVDGDGKVTAYDAYDILQYSSGQYLGDGAKWADILK